MEEVGERVVNNRQGGELRRVEGRDTGGGVGVRNGE